MKTAHQKVQNLIANHGKETVVDYIKQWANVHYAEIDSDCDVWISDPCAGHWLPYDRLEKCADDIEEYIRQFMGLYGRP